MANDWRSFAGSILGCCILLLQPLSTRSDPSQSDPLTASIDPDSVLARTLRSLQGRPLRLQEALDLGNESSPLLNQSRADLDAAKSEVRIQQGAFDPELFATFEWRNTNTPTASIFAGADVLNERSTASSFGARKTLQFGTQLVATIGTREVETNNALANLDPEYRTTSQIEIRQPLLRGLGPATRGELTSAEHALEAQRLRTRQTQRSELARIEILYWKLYAAERDYAVQLLIVQQSAAFLGQTRLRAAAGLIGPNQVATAEVFDAQQGLALLDQEESLDAASDQLSEVIGPRRPVRQRFHTVDEPRSLAKWSQALEPVAVVKKALTSNLALRAARHDLAALQARAAAATWQARPRLDLVGTLGGNGLSGQGQEIVFGGDTLRTNLDSGLGDALGQSLALDHSFWSAGFEFQYPLGLRKEKGLQDQRRAEVSRGRYRLTALERKTESEVRDALRRLHNGEQRLTLSRRAVDAAREQIRVGQIEFDSGRTTAFELVRLSADLASTQQEYSSALVRTVTARADLERLVDGLAP